jgi:uncharacterized protein with GYD domain
MPTYITLFRYTQKGMVSIQEGPARLDGAKRASRLPGQD